MSASHEPLPPRSSILLELQRACTPGILPETGARGPGWEPHIHHSTAGRREHGFSLLEAIVALTLISTVGMALYGWINGSLQAFYRIQLAEERTDALRNALEWMKNINPIERPIGETTLGDLRIDWRAEPIRPLVDGTGFPAGIGLYQVGLFETEVEVRWGTEPQMQAVFSLWQIGHEQVREPEMPF